MEYKMYFYVKRKTKNKEEKVGMHIFTNGVLHEPNKVVAEKMKHNLVKYYGVKTSDKSPKELKESKEKK